MSGRQHQTTVLDQMGDLVHFVGRLRDINSQYEHTRKPKATIPAI
jgi:hypothetical protein